MKDIKGFEGIYAITKNGEIWSYGKRKGASHNGRFLKIGIDKDGYRKIALTGSDGKKHHKRVGRLMLETYKPTQDKKLQANHIDSDRKNDNLDNLEWVTSSQNIKHSFEKLGKNQKGIKNNGFKKWGFILQNKKTVCDDITVDEWCIENGVTSPIIYKSIKENREIKKGKLKGYKFFRVG